MKQGKSKFQWRPEFFRADQSGTTAIEYALIIVGISFALMTIVYSVGDTLVELFQWIQDNILNRP